MTASVVSAQSTDRDAPTPLTTSSLEERGIMGQAQTFYYSFTTDPGELKLTLDVDAGSTNGNGVVASYSLQTRDGGEILSADAYATPGQPARIVKRTTFRKATPVILQVQLPPGATADYTYSLKLSGAAQMRLPRPADSPSLR
jgi:hypothetical protein